MPRSIGQFTGRLRFYDVTRGSIRVDDRDLRDIRLEDLRGHIGMVAQQTLLFSGTVAKNIAYGHPNASTAEVIEAARAANAHEFIIRMPDGYDSQVGENGGKLSGGGKAAPCDCQGDSPKSENPHSR